MPLLRDEKGRVLGGRMDAATKKAISRGQIARHKRNREQQGPRPDKKRCSKCGETKLVPDEFPMRRRKLKSGAVVKYPAGECLKCQGVRREAWREQQDPEKMRERQRVWNRSRDREKRRRYNREYQRMKRRMEGAQERGPWKRYAHEAGDLGRDRRVSRGPLDAYLAELRIGAKEIELRTGVDDTTIGRTTNKMIQASIVDQVLTGLGVPDQLVVLYPELNGGDPSQ